MKSLLIGLFILWPAGAAFGQFAEYKKFSLSVHAGPDFPIGTSNTAGIDPDFTVPFSKGFGGTFDGAYFLTKNYGVGLKYHYFNASGDGDEPVHSDKLVIYTFDETTHYVGPALYGRWALGTSNWEVPVNISAGYVYNKLSNLSEKVRYSPDVTDEDKDYGRTDLKNNTIGFMLSAGIRYRVTPAVGVGVYANCLFAGVKKKVIATDYSGNSFEIDLSRKMNRIGFSAGVDFSF